MSLLLSQLVSARSDELQLPQESTKEDTKEDAEKSDSGETERSNLESPESSDTAPEAQLDGDTEAGAPLAPSGLLSALSDAVQKVCLSSLTHSQTRFRPPNSVY